MMHQPQDPSSPRRLSETVQAAVSAALVVYLAGLLLSIAGNSSSGSSALVRTLKGRLFGPWMAPAWLDLGFDHPLTHGMPEDGDHLLEVRGWGARAVTRYPGELAGERAARWRRLARRVALAAAEDSAAPLAAGLGGGSFGTCDGEDVLVRVLRRPLEDRAAAPAEPALRRAYAARVRRVDGELQLIEMGGQGDRGERAPVLRSADTEPLGDDAPREPEDAP